MSDKNEKDLANTRDLFDFLQGNLPEGYQVAPDHMPKLTADQAATVIWYLGNQYWQVTDHVERCEVCGDWYNAWCEGECLDFGKAPYHFCGNCCAGEEAQQKRRVGRGIERAKKRQCLLANIKST
ncbi:MAG: hypothetical protein Q8M02_10555 [Candidatus Didemnitutus sp.]|nr:hypothetical protein [Candidatus Didemnitutus sp.]